jgi:hypothetical protein
MIAIHCCGMPYVKWAVAIDSAAVDMFNTIPGYIGAPVDALAQLRARQEDTLS